MSKPRIPKIDSIEELARFWDTHDPFDFEDELEEVTAPLFERRNGTGLTVPLSGEERAAVERIARTKGLRDVDLVRQWVSEKIATP